MDAFKVAEVKRMQLGGNNPWKKFFDDHQENQLEGKTFDGSTVKDRYDSAVGEEWKERLTAKVEGKEYVPGQEKKVERARSGTDRSATPLGMGGRGGVSAGPASARSQSPAASAMGGRPSKVQNEAFFAKMGEANAGRSDDLPPSQGGKFAGFGSEPMPPAGSGNNDWLNDFQKDPMSGLTKGFGWLGKNAKTGFDGWVKPNVQKVGPAFVRSLEPSADPNYVMNSSQSPTSRRTLKCLQYR